MAIIKAIGVHKTYDTGKIQVEALRGIDLEVKKGEMIAVMGPSGCGKTTLLNCLSGLDDLTDGKVLIEKQDIHAMKDNPRTDGSLPKHIKTSTIWDKNLSSHSFACLTFMGSDSMKLP